MLMLVVRVYGAFVGFLVAVEAASFAIQHLNLKAMAALNPHKAWIDFRIWSAIAVASFAWIVTVHLTAQSLRAFFQRWSGRAGQ